MAGDAGFEDYRKELVTQGDVPGVQGAVALGKRKRQGDPEQCTICLEPISERAVAVPCNHLTFDFLCLVSWLQERTSCPLCKAEVGQVQYDWRSPRDYKTYHVPPPKISSSNSGVGQVQPLSRRGRDRRPVERWTPQAERALAASEDPALDRRRRVYRDRLYSLHVGANRISQYRDFTPESLACSPELQSRGRAFLRRELNVFTFLDTASGPRGGNREFLIEYIVAVLKTNQLKGADGHAEDLLADFVGRENARQLIHELEAWLRSPYMALSDWDRHVQYADRSGGRAAAKYGVG